MSIDPVPSEPMARGVLQHALGDILAVALLAVFAFGFGLGAGKTYRGTVNPSVNECPLIHRAS